MIGHELRTRLTPSSVSVRCLVKRSADLWGIRTMFDYAKLIQDSGEHLTGTDQHDPGFRQGRKGEILIEKLPLIWSGRRPRIACGSCPKQHAAPMSSFVLQCSPMHRDTRRPQTCPSDASQFFSANAIQVFLGSAVTSQSMRRPTPSGSVHLSVIDTGNRHRAGGYRPLAGGILPSRPVGWLGQYEGIGLGVRR